MVLMKVDTDILLSFALAYLFFGMTFVWVEFF